MPVLAPDNVRLASPLRLGPLLDLRDRGAEDLVLHGLAVTVELFQPVGEPARLIAILCEQQVQRRARVAEPAGRVDPRREAEPHLPGVDRRRVDPRHAHQRLQPGLLRARERAQAGDRERAVLAHQRYHVGDRRERDEVDVPAQDVCVRPEQCLPELVRDAGPAQFAKRIRRRARGDDRAVRQLLGRPVMVGDDHVEPELPRPAYLLDGRDPAVDGQHQAAALLREPLERAAVDAVAFVEAARQMPLHVRAELAQDKDGQHRGADAVDVVVAVHADALPRRDRGPDALDRTGHVAEQEGIVQGLFPREEHPRLLGVAVAAPDEHACRDLAEAELLGEETGLPVRARTDRPGALLHRRSKLRRASDDIVRALTCKRAAARRVPARP